MNSVPKQPWQQMLALTEQMVSVAQSQEWVQLVELQQERDQLMQQLPAASADNATLLETILGLNQQLESLSEQQRQQLTKQVRRGQQTRQGIHAYQQVTGASH